MNKHKQTICWNPCWGEAVQAGFAGAVPGATGATVATGMTDAGAVQATGPVLFAGGLGDPHWWPPGLKKNQAEIMKYFFN